MNAPEFETLIKNASRKCKIKRSCQDIDYVTGGTPHEKSIKDAVLKTFEQRTRFLPDNEARMYARQLSKAFKIAGEALE